jgi:hypothetical protein
MYMDELVAVGTAGLIGLAVTGVLLIGGILWVSSVVWNASVTGNWAGIAEFFLALILLAALYTGTGIWLQKTGRI